MLLIIYWVILVLCLIGAFAPSDWTYAPRFNSIVVIVLFIIIGLKIFKTPLQ